MMPIIKEASELLGENLVRSFLCECECKYVAVLVCVCVCVCILNADVDVTM